MRYLLIILITFTFFGCSPKKEVLPFDEMKVAVWEMACSEQYAPLWRVGDSSLKPEQKMVAMFYQTLKYGNINKDKFYNTLAYYTKNPREQKLLFDSVIVYGERMRKNLDKPVEPIKPVAPGKKNLKREAVQLEK